MTRSAEALINPQILVWARETLRMEVAEAARRLGVPEERYSAWETGDARPTTTQLKKVANVLKRPFAAFYLTVVPDDRRRPPQDFRHAPGHVLGELSSELVLDIDVALDRRDIVLELTRAQGRQVSTFQPSAELDQDPEIVGARLRSGLGVAADVPGDPREALNYWRSHAEGCGVLVFQSSALPVGQMRGVSLHEEPLPIVVLNRKEAYAGRSFTLLHELAHLMLRRGGVCDLEDVDGLPPEQRAVEVFCNAVAAAVLIPMSALKAHERVARHKGAEWEDDELRTIARSFGASPEAVLRRLLTANLTTRSFYEKKRKQFEEEYKALARRGRESSGFVPPSTDVVSLAGKPYSRLVLEALDAGQITPNDASDYLGVRIKHFDDVREKSA